MVASLGVFGVARSSGLRLWDGIATGVNPVPPSIKLSKLNIFMPVDGVCIGMADSATFFALTGNELRTNNKSNTKVFGQ